MVITSSWRCRGQDKVSSTHQTQTQAQKQVMMHQPCASQAKSEQHDEQAVSLAHLLAKFFPLAPRFSNASGE